MGTLIALKPPRQLTIKTKCKGCYPKRGDNELALGITQGTV
jgi:hypothetical protein